MKIYQGRLEMTDIKTNFRIGILTQRNLIEFNGWLLDEMRKAALSLRNEHKFAEASMGKGRKVF